MSNDIIASPARHASLPKKMLGLLKRPEVAGMITAVLIKAGLVLLNFTLITLAARALDPQAFGHYSILYSAASLLFVVAAVGQEPFILRVWNEMTASGDAARLKGALLFTCTACCCGLIAVTTLLWPWALAYDHKGAMAAVLYLIFSAPLQICVHLVRTEMGALWGDGMSFAIVGVPPVTYLAICLLTGAPASIANIFLTMSAGVFIALVIQILLIRHRIIALFPDFSNVPRVFERAQWMSRSAKLWLTASLEAANQYLDVIIIGFLMDPATAGAYFVTVRLANLFAAAADAINLFATQHLPGLYYRDERRELTQMLDKLAWITLIFIVVGLLGILLGGYLAFWIINADYTRYYPELLVLCLGTAAAATTRSSTLILMLSGHEGRYLSITAAGVVIRALCLVGFVPHFGVMGAVAASAVSYALQAVAFRYSDRRLTGLDASMFRLLNMGGRSRPQPH
jgi:O-antigen/teichoic acid export membrane protein